MNRYKVVDIVGSFGLFLDDIVEADNYVEAIEQVLNEIDDNLGNYIDIELEEIDGKFDKENI